MKGKFLSIDQMGMKQRKKIEFYTHINYFLLLFEFRYYIIDAMISFIHFENETNEQKKIFSFHAPYENNNKIVKIHLKPKNIQRKKICSRRTPKTTEKKTSEKFRYKNSMVRSLFCTNINNGAASGCFSVRLL